MGALFSADERRGLMGAFWKVMGGMFSDSPPARDDLEANERGDASAGPTHAGRFDADELRALRAAHARGGAAGLSRAQLRAGFDALLPTPAIERLFVALAGAAAPADAEGEGSGIAWAGWVDGLALMAKPPPLAHSERAANARRLRAWFDLFCDAHVRPSDAVLALDARLGDGPQPQPQGGGGGEGEGGGGGGAQHAAAELEPPGALDERALTALLACAMRLCADARRVPGASGFAPLLRDALLGGPLSRAAWVRWAGACVPRLGEVLELALLEGVGVLAAGGGAPPVLPRVAALRAALSTPELVCAPLEVPRSAHGGGGAAEGAEAEGGAVCPSALLSWALVWAVSLGVPSAPLDEQQRQQRLCPSWRLLYASSQHGLGANRFSKHVLGYKGPTLLACVCKHAEGAEGGAQVAWAAYVDEPWKAAGKAAPFGGEACRLLSLRPGFHAHAPKGGGAHRCALFSQPVHAILGGGGSGRHGGGGAAAEEEMLAWGGGYGAAASQYRCALRADMTRAHLAHSDGTYEDDLLRRGAAGVPPLTLDGAAVGAVEVWGLGGGAADDAQTRARSAAEAGRARAGRVNRAAFGETWNDTPDKMLLELGGHNFYSDQLGPRPEEQT